MSTPPKFAGLVASLGCCLFLLVLAGCMSSKTAGIQDDLRPTGLAGTREKSRYEMAVSNEAVRLRKENPALSQKEALSTARSNVGNYDSTETPQEQKARKLKEAQKDFAANLEESMKR